LEWLHKYVSAYSSPSYEDREKLLLMEVSLDVTNELFENDQRIGLVAWLAVSSVIRGNRDLHREQIVYWALPDTPLEDAWAIAPLARALLRELFPDQCVP